MKKQIKDITLDEFISICNKCEGYSHCPIKDLCSKFFTISPNRLTRKDLDKEIDL